MPTQYDINNSSTIADTNFMNDKSMANMNYIFGTDELPPNQSYDPMAVPEQQPQQNINTPPLLASTDPMAGADYFAKYADKKIKETKQNWNPQDIKEKEEEFTYSADFLQQQKNQYSNFKDRADKLIKEISQETATLL